MLRCCAHRIRRALLSLILPLLAYAEQLPIRIYRTADGLAENYVNAIAADKSGYLWFGTNEGLSRFEGFEFTNYGVNEGLPHAVVSALLVTSDGGLWIGTGRGLCRFNPESPSPSGQRFTVYRPSAVSATQVVDALAEDRDGSIWCGTRAGLFRLRRLAPSSAQFDHVDVGEPNGAWDTELVTALVVDRRGALWIGTNYGLYRRGLDAQIQHFTTRNGLPSDAVRSLSEDRHGRLWVGTDRGPCLLAPDPDPRGRAVTAVYPLNRGWVNATFETSDGRLWFATNTGLWESIRGGAPGEIQGFRSYTTANGLSDDNLNTLAEDRDGNLWLGTETGGAMKIALNGIRTYTEADGLRGTRINSLFESRAGDLFAITEGRRTEKFLQRFDGKSFVAIPLRPNGISTLGWGSRQIGFEDHAGEWWVATAHGLCRFPHVARFEQLQYARPKAIYTTRDGLAGNLIFRVFEDSRGDIWISSTDGQGGNGLCRWQRSTGSLRDFSREPGFGDEAPPTVFREDRTGALWTGFSSGRVARYRDNRFLFFGPDDIINGGNVNDIFTDDTGRLWIGTGQAGLMRIDDPSSEHPRPITYTTAQGLSSNAIRCITEDLFGRLYIGTGRGLDRLNPDGRFEHFTTADGLALGQTVVAHRDRQGALWFGSLQGLSRWLPEPPQRNSPPPILIRGIRVRGVPQPISELGESAVQPFSLATSQNQLQFDFVSIGFRPAERSRYQYMLEGTDSEWRTTESRTVNYASLPPAPYRFLVRAVDSSGALSPAPAIASFTILPPYWQRWWFRLMALITSAVILYSASRLRVRRITARVRLRYEERLNERTRIARELHDTLLQSLAGVSLQLDGLAKQIGPSSEAAAGRIRAVRQQVEASFREARQKVQDLRSPMLHGRYLSTVLRESLEQIVAGHPVRLQVTVAGRPRRLREEVDEALLRIGQEAVANAVRHAQATEIQVCLFYEHGSAGLRIRDDGQGFNQDDARLLVGHWGLRNMQERAHHIGAQWNITTAAGCGTEIEAIVPLVAGR
jgi:signal transduction histidine kinase/ligand-binding sensor domain-containing protein